MSDSSKRRPEIRKPASRALLPDDQDEIAKRHRRMNTAIGAIALLAMTLLAYAPAFHAGFIWDDDDYVTQNATLRSIDGLKRIWFEPGAVPQYYPLVHTTFWLEYHLWDADPAGYHIINIILHALSAILLWVVLRRLAFSPALAWVASAVFALHPVHVESVAWITERKNVLSATFYFLSLLAYLRFSPLDEFDSAPERRRVGGMWGTGGSGEVLFSQRAVLSRSALEQDGDLHAARRDFAIDLVEAHAHPPR